MKRLLVSILLACCGSVTEMSRAQVAGGSVSGEVTDPSGASVPRAKVILRSLATQSERALTTNLEGFYTAANLVPGDYEVTVGAGDPLGQKSSATIDFPNRLAAPGCGSAVNPGYPVHYIRTQCFAFPAPATLLGASGRNLSGPGLVNADFSLVTGAGLLDTTATPSRQIQFALKFIW
jgi:hypothetical protein